MEIFNLLQISSEENVAEGSKSKIVLDLEITFPEVTSLVPQPWVCVLKNFGYFQRC